MLLMVIVVRMVVVVGCCYWLLLFVVVFVVLLLWLVVVVIVSSHLKTSLKKQSSRDGNKIRKTTAQGEFLGLSVGLLYWSVSRLARHG